MSTEREITIKQMPSKEVLEAFVRGMMGHPTVIFNYETGQFETLRPQEPLGQPITERGEQWRRL